MEGLNHDMTAVAAWMSQQGLGEGPITGVSEITGGTQNIMLRLHRSGREYVFRRGPRHLRPVSNSVILRETRVLRALAGTDVPHAGLIAVCEDTSVLGPSATDGAVFYLMEPVDGFNAGAGLPALHAAMCAVVQAAPEQARLDLIRSHPDLVGRAALAGTLTRESTAEQRAAGLDAGALTAAEVARFSEANAAYRKKFGFPFVIFARENRKEAILAGFERRLGNTQPREIAAAVAEIERIAWHRLADLVRHDPA